MDDEFLYKPCDMHLRNRANRFANHMGSREIESQKIEDDFLNPELPEHRIKVSLEPREFMRRIV